MQRVKIALVSIAALCAGAVLVANWRDHRETQRKLDLLDAHLTGLSPRPAEPAPAVSAEPKRLPPMSSDVIPASASTPRELVKATPTGPVIEPPDVLVIEALLRDPRTNQTERLPVQPIAGEFLVRPDGTVALGVWGNVPVNGLTPEKAADAIKRKLSVFTQVNGSDSRSENVIVTVAVKSNNSKVYFIIMDEGNGEQVMRQPVTGTETVLDAIAAVPGVAAQADRRTIRVVRAAPNGPAGAPPQVLPVDWDAIMRRGDTRTNYGLLSGDRVYISAPR